MASQSIVLAHQCSFRIGAAEVRPASRLLEGPDGAQLLEPRVMQVLVALHDAAGGVLSKDDLIECCWDGRVVGEDAINRTIGNLRRACMAAGSPFRIETIPRVGVSARTALPASARLNSGLVTSARKSPDWAMAASSVSRLRVTESIWL